MVVDAGGRGQAIAKKLAGEGLEVIVSPGNPGNEAFAHSTGVGIGNINGQLEAAERYDADLTIVGPEDALNQGIAWAWRTAQFFGAHTRERAMFAPSARQAWVESDRSFAKKFAQAREVPIGGFDEYTDKQEAMRDVAALDSDDERYWPLFVKDNGLHQGKGVTTCFTPEEVEAAVAALDHFVIETNVPGPELSHHAFCDGKTQLSIPFVVRDHKQLLVDGMPEMTGGMGVIGPLPEYSLKEVNELGETFAAPVAEGLGFKGMLFSGLKGHKGAEKLLEWNARFGDPETQVFMRLMKGDLLPVIMACVEGDLQNLTAPEWELGTYAACLVLAAPGYPSEPRKNLLIEGIEEAAKLDGVDVLQAATTKRSDQLCTDGGRVINIIATADSVEDAAARAYCAADKISFDGQPPVTRPNIGASSERL
jgi:phosphoribosylamine--glycine ligase